MKDRETKQVRAVVVENADKEPLQGFVKDRMTYKTVICTDDHASYQGFKNHASVKEYKNWEIYKNRVESFWPMLKSGYFGMYHKRSA